MSNEPELLKAEEYFLNMKDANESKKYEDGFSNFKKLATLYGKLCITDTTFLIMRGMPPLPLTLENSVDILKGTDKENVQITLVNLESELDKYGKETLLNFLTENEIIIKIDKVNFWNRIFKSKSR